jgi:hypothetical protein
MQLAPPAVARIAAPYTLQEVHPGQVLLLPKKLSTYTAAARQQQQ